MRPSETSTPSSNIAQTPPTVSNTSAPVTPPRSAEPSKPAPIVHLRGRADAPVLIEEYADFQCPPCGFFHPILKKLEGEYETQLRVAFHHFPIRTMHKHAAEAARAAEAAGMQGKFWQMHDLLFENQKKWNEAPAARPIFLSYASTLGLNLEKFSQDIDSMAANNRIITDETAGAARGVTGTPTVFLNGREIKFEEATNYNTLRALIERELAATK